MGRSALWGLGVPGGRGVLRADSHDCGLGLGPRLGLVLQHASRAASIRAEGEAWAMR